MVARPPQRADAGVGARVLAGNKKLGRIGIASTLTLWVLVVLAAVAALLWRSVLFTLATNWLSLLVLQAVLRSPTRCCGSSSTIDTLRLVRFVRIGTRARFGVAALAAVLLVVTSGTAKAYASNVVNVDARDTLGPIFGERRSLGARTDEYYNIPPAKGEDPDKGTQLDAPGQHLRRVGERRHSAVLSTVPPATRRTLACRYNASGAHALSCSPKLIPWRNK